LVNRINIFRGLDWQAVPVYLTDRKALSPSYDNPLGRTHIVIGCVDTRTARAVIRDATSNFSSVDYWLDIGNNADSGQFILGEPLNQTNRRSRIRLRTIAELYPESVNPTLDNDGQPSCSAIEALERQEPFVNSALAQGWSRLACTPLSLRENHISRRLPESRERCHFATTDQSQALGAHAQSQLEEKRCGKE